MEQELAFIAQFYSLIVEFFVNYSFQVIGAIVIFIIGLFIARWLGRLTQKICLKNNVDITLAAFIASTVRLIFIAMVLVICLGKFGISIAPFVAAIGAISLSLGLAFQSVFSNYGAGFTIILTRPFKIGNTISVCDVNGIVEEITLAHTRLITEDGETITIPNKHIVGEVIVNSYENKVVEASIGVAYSADTVLAIKVISQLLGQEDGVVKSPKAQVGIANFGDSAIEIDYRYWVPTERYFEIQYRVNAKILEHFQQQNIEIPFPQREIRVFNAPNTHD